jgi:nicotinamide mononucleotide transporter
MTTWFDAILILISRLTLAQWASIAEWLGAAAGFVYVIGAIRERSWCWLASLVSTGLYAFVFWHQGLWGQATLQLYYLPASIYGYWVWRGKSDQPLRQVSWLKPRAVLAWVMVVLATSAVAWFGLNAAGVDESALDVLTAVGSLVATYLMSIKKIDNWIFWIVIDAIISILLIQQRLWISVGLYGLFIVLAAIGFASWYAILRSQPPSDASDVIV